MTSDATLQQMQRDLIAMDRELKELMIMLDRTQTGRLFRPIVQLDPVTRERVRTRLDFARSLIIKLATLLAVPPEVPDFLHMGQEIITRQLARLVEYRPLTDPDDGRDTALSLQAIQALQQLQESLQAIQELLMPAEAARG